MDSVATSTRRPVGAVLLAWFAVLGFDFLLLYVLLFVIAAVVTTIVLQSVGLAPATRVVYV